MERQNSGLSKICTAYENAANYQLGLEPTFRSNRVEFTVKLPNLNFKASSDEALTEALNEAVALTYFNQLMSAPFVYTRVQLWAFFQFKNISLIPFISSYIFTIFIPKSLNRTFFLGTNRIE